MADFIKWGTNKIRMIYIKSNLQFKTYSFNKLLYFRIHNKYVCFQGLIIEVNHLIRHNMVFKIILQMDECWWVYSAIQGSYNQTLTLKM